MNRFLLLGGILAFTSANGQLTHPDFEQVWVTGQGIVPAGWTLDWFGAEAVGDAHGGTYALGLWNWYYTSHGWAANGTTTAEVNEFNNAGGEPMAWKPDQLEGWYKYVPDDNQGMVDSAVVRVVLKHWNNVTQMTEIVAEGELHLGPASNYIPFTVPVIDVMPGTEPDTVRVTFISSITGFCDVGGDGQCLYLTVDDLSLSGPQGVMPVGFSAPGAWVADDGLHMNGSQAGAPFLVCDASGRIVDHGHTTGAITALPEFPRGAYVLLLDDRRPLRFVR